VLDFRTLPGQRHEDLVAALGAREPRAALSLTRDLAPVLASPESRLVRVAQEVMAQKLPTAAVRGMPYVTDGSVLAAASDATIVILGPGDIRLAHGPDEYLPLDQLELAVDCYEGIVSRLLYA
jgi:acetylornithine deacetylase/succinyl-diaminopimelate desuccinylase-like protein